MSEKRFHLLFNNNHIGCFWSRWRVSTASASPMMRQIFATKGYMSRYGPIWSLFLTSTTFFCISNKVDIWLRLALYAWVSFQTVAAILGLCTNCNWPRITLQDTIEVIRAGGLRQRCSDCIFVQASMLLPVFSVLRVEFVIYSVSGYHELWISQSIILMLKKAPLGKALLKSLMEYLLMLFSTESNFSK